MTSFLSATADGQRIAAAVDRLLRPASSPEERLAADAELRAWQASETVVPSALALLAEAPSCQPQPVAVALLGATALRRALARGHQKDGGGDVAMRTVLLQLAKAFSVRGERAVVLQLASALASRLLFAGEAVMQGVDWLLEELLLASNSCNCAAMEVMLLALAAISEELLSPELALGPLRAQVLADLRGAGPRIVRSLDSATGGCKDVERLFELQFRAGAAWFALGGFDDVTLATVARESSLLPLAGKAVAHGGPDVAAASEAFICQLLEQCAVTAACPRELIDVVLGILVTAWSSSDAQSRAGGELNFRALIVCRLVAAAVDAWKYHFINYGAAPPPVWEKLLRLLLSSAEAHPQMAYITIPSWAALHEITAANGCLTAYAPVLLQAVHALRKAGVERPGPSLEASGHIGDFRKELFSLLSQLVSPPCAIEGVAEQICADLLKHATALRENMEQDSCLALEEALYSLSAISGPLATAAHESLYRGGHANANAACESSSLALVRQVLEAFKLLCGIFGLLGDRCSIRPIAAPRIFCAFLTCATEAVPLFGLPQRRPELFESHSGALLSCILQGAGMSLCIPEITGEFQFQCVRQELHAGVACFLAIAEAYGDELARAAPQELSKLRSELCRCLGSITNSGKTLLRPSVFGLARGLATVAVHDGELAHALLVDCFNLAKDRAAHCGAEAELGAVIEIVQTCGPHQRAALARALASFWELLGGQVPLHAPTLARLLSSLIEAVQADLLPLVARVIAVQAGSSKESLHMLLAPANAFVLRAKLQAGDSEGFADNSHDIVPIATELVLGLSRLSWTALCASGESFALKLGGSKDEDGCEDTLLGAWLRFVVNAYRQIPTALAAANGEALSFAIMASACALAGLACVRENTAAHSAANMRSPPVVLEILTENWHSTPGLEHQMREVLLAPAPTMLSKLLCGSQTSLGALALCGLAELSRPRRGGAVLARHAVAAADGIARAVGPAYFADLGEQASQHLSLALPSAGVTAFISGKGKGKVASSERLLRHLANASSGQAELRHAFVKAFGEQ